MPLDAGSCAGERYAAAAVCGLLLLAVALAFGRSVGHDFVFDDFLYLRENPHMARGLSTEGIAWAFTTAYAANWHPLTWLSLMLDRQFYDWAPWGYHLTNVVLHAGVAIGLFLALRRMTGELWPSALAAALFAVHPLRVESVAWVAERKDVLSGLFFVLALWAYAGYARRPFSCVGYLAVCGWFALGLMAKPMLATLPLVLLLLDYWPLGRMGLGWRLVVEKLPLLALSAASCVLTLLAQRTELASLDVVPLGSRVANAVVSYAAYVGQFVWPAGLAVFYPYPDAGRPIWQVAGALLLLLVITAAAAACWRRFPWLPVGWFWYLGMLVPVIGLVQVGNQAMADRYTYLPQIGLAIGVAWGAKRALGAWPQHAWACGAGAALALAVLMGCTWRQTGYWRNSETLWSRAVDCTSSNAFAHGQLGLALFAERRLDQAVTQYQKCLEINPNDDAAHSNLGLALREQGHVAEAIDHYRKALEINPDLVTAHHNLGLALHSQGNFAEAIRHYRRAIEINPGFARTHFDLARALVNLGQIEEAAFECSRTLELNPDFLEVYSTVARILAGRGQMDDAIGLLHTALKIKPDDAEARYNLGIFLYQKGRLSEAMAQWNELIHIQPEYVPVLNEVAWALATDPEASVRDGTRAVELAQRAVKLSGGQEPNFLDTLAAAQAEAGQFAEAVKTAEQAVAVASSQNNTALAEGIRTRIKLYQSGSGYQETPKAPVTKSSHP